METWQAQISVKELLDGNLIEESHVVNPLSIATNSSGKQRLILDLRY